MYLAVDGHVHFANLIFLPAILSVNTYFVKFQLGSKFFMREIFSPTKYQPSISTNMKAVINELISHCIWTLSSMKVFQ